MQTRNRKFYLLVGAFLVCAVLMGVFTAFRSGPTELQRFKAELRVKGEKLTLAELLPDALRTNRTHGRMDDLVRIGNALDAQNKQVAKLELTHHIGNGFAEPVWARTNLIIWTSGTTPVTTIEWSELESDLTAMEDMLAEAQALVAVPDAHAGMNYGFRVKLPKYRSDMLTVARWFAGVHAMSLKRRKVPEAVASLAAVLRLAEWHSEELTMPDQLNRTILGTIALRLTWSTLQESTVPDAQLAELLAKWQRLDLSTTLPRVLEVEQATGQHIFNLAREQGVSGVYGESEKIADAFFRVTSGEADELFCLRQTQALLGMARKSRASRSFATVQSGLAAQDLEVEAAFFSLAGLFRLPVSRVALSRSKNETSVRRFFHYETFREMALAALALELHRRKHGRHPASLERLAPEFLPAVPVDWMDGKPIRYRLNPDGTFTLWSVGDDFKDDGGDATDAGTATGLRAKDIWDGRDAVWPHPPP